MLDRPSPSVTTLRTFSIRAGLAASTVTPGSTPPEASLTTPAIPLAVACCAEAAGDSSNTHMTTLRTTPTTFTRTIDFLLLSHPCAQAAISDATCTRLQVVACQRLVGQFTVRVSTHIPDSRCSAL